MIVHTMRTSSQSSASRNFLIMTVMTVGTMMTGSFGGFVARWRGAVVSSERDTCTLYSVLMVWLESYGNYEKKLNRHGHVPKGTEYPRIS